MAIKQRNFSLFFDKSFSKGFWKQIIWLLLLMLVVYLFLILLSYHDFFYTPGDDESQGRWYDVLFMLMDPGSPTNYLHSPYALLIGVTGMAVFSGMLISVISNLLERRVDNYIAGETNYKVSNHVIVLGFNRSVPSLLSRINEEHENAYIIIMSERDSNVVRDSIHANVNREVENRLIVMNGERNAGDDLLRLCLHRNPLEIYILGEENEDGHDEISLESVKKIASLLPEDKKVPCYVQIDSGAMFSILQQVDFIRKASERDNRDFKNLMLHPFNFNEIWAQKVLSLTSFKGKDYFPLDGTGITEESNKKVHLIIVGMTSLGKALAVNAAHILHFPNFREGDFSTYSRITFIDPEAKERGERFRNRYSILFDLVRWKEDKIWHDPLADPDSQSPYRYLGPENFMDIEWEFLTGDIASPSVRNYLESACNEENSITNVALCGDDSDRNLAICLGLPLNIFEGSSLNMFLVYQKENDIAVEMISDLPSRGEKVRAFGMMNECYRQNLLTDEFGKLINALYSSIDITDPQERTKIEKAWDEIDFVTDKWSSNYSANMLFVKLRSLGFNQGNINKEALDSKLNSDKVKNWIQRTEHNRWNIERILLGFAPLTREEQEKYITDMAELQKLPATSDEEKKEKKNRIKGFKKGFKERKKHQDICSNDTLIKIDPDVAQYDEWVNNCLWDLYQKINEMKN